MPTSNADLIERRLGVRLPFAYQQLQNEYPLRLRETRSNLSWKHEPISERELYGDPERIIQANIDQRQLETPWFGEEIEPWPDHMLVIGDDECGNYWCLDLRGPGDRVVFYNHDIGAFEADSDSLAEYIEKTVRQVEEFNRDREDDRALNGVRFFLPDAQMNERVGDTTPFAEYIRTLQRAAGSFWPAVDQLDAKGVLITVGVRPGGRSKVWCEAVGGEIPEATLQKLQAALEKVPPVTVKGGPIAFAMEMGLHGQMPPEFPVMPKSWAEAAKAAQHPLMVPDGLFEVIWPE